MNNEKRLVDAEAAKELWRKSLEWGRNSADFPRAIGVGIRYALRELGLEEGEEEN